MAHDVIEPVLSPEQPHGLGMIAETFVGEGPLAGGVLRTGSTLLREAGAPKKPAEGSARGLNAG